MTQVLGNNDILNKDLLEIMNHDDAEWAPEDWSRPIDPLVSQQMLSHSSPDFLQPSHEPNFLQLPSMLQALGGNSSTPRPLELVNPTVPQSPSMPYIARSSMSTPYHGGQEWLGLPGRKFENYSGYGARPEQTTSQPPNVPVSWATTSFGLDDALPLGDLVPDSTPLSQHHLSPSWHHDRISAPSRFARDTMDMVLPSGHMYGRNEPHGSAAYASGLYEDYPQYHQWQGIYSKSEWANGSPWQHDNDDLLASHVPNQATPHLAPQQLSSNASPSMIATPTTKVANNHEANRNEWHTGGLEYVDSEKDNNDHATYESNPFAATKHDESDAGITGEDEEKRLAAKSSPKPEGSFIHAICGTGFHSRSAVKKHHWGPKAGDLTTTRGCWTKNKRPDVAWQVEPWERRARC